MSLVQFYALFTPELAIAAVAAVMGATVRAYSGFGTNIILAPVLAILFGPVEAIAIMGIANMISVIPLCVSVAPNVQWREISPIMVAIVLLAPLGVYLLVSVDPLLVRRSIGGIVLVIGIILFTGWTYHGSRGVPVRLGVGSLAGVIAGFSGVGGPIVVLYLMSGPGEARTQRANNMFSVGIMAPIVIAVLLFNNAITVETVVRTLLLLIPMFIGQWAGVRLFNALPESLFRGMVLSLLIIVGASALLL